MPAPSSRTRSAGRLGASRGFSKLTTWIEGVGASRSRYPSTCDSPSGSAKPSYVTYRMLGRRPELTLESLAGPWAALGASGLAGGHLLRARAAQQVLLRAPVLDAQARTAAAV